ncbi:MAG: histidine kinase [Agriterribacter sp.]
MINFSSHFTFMCAGIDIHSLSFTRKIMYLLFFLICCNTSFSQQNKLDKYFQDPVVKHRIDSLRKILPSLKNTERIDCLNALSEIHLLKNNISNETDTARKYAVQALNESQKINYIVGKANAYKCLGRVESTYGSDLVAVEKYFDSSLFFFERIGDKTQMGWSFEAVGYAKWIVGKFEPSMQSYEKALTFYEAAGDTTRLINLFDLMSRTALEWGHYDQALTYALKSEELTGKENNAVMAMLYGKIGEKKTALEYFRRDYPKDGWYYLGMGCAFSDNKMYDSAMYCFRIFADFAKNASDAVLAKSYARFGELYLTLHQYDSSLFYLHKALLIHKKANDANQVLWVQLALSKAYAAIGNNEKAMPLARATLRLAETMGTKHYQAKSHFLLYQLFLEVRANDSAFYHLRKYTTLKDEMENEVLAHKLSFYKTTVEKQKDEARITLLKQEKLWQEQLFIKTKQQKNILIAGLLLLCAIGVIIFRNILLKKKNDKLIMENRMEMQRLENEKAKGELEQQSAELKMQALRAQMNPHFIYNSLGSINLFILQNDQEKASEFLVKFSRLVRLILQNSLTPFITLDRELEALQLYLELESLRFNDHFTFTVKVQPELDASLIKVPPLLIQPYVENAIWHGLLRKEEQPLLTIDIYREDAFLCCSITDNGIGRNKAAELKRKVDKNHVSLGMKLSEDRIAILNQNNNSSTSVEVRDLTLPDGSAGGTEVLLKIPFHYD